MNPNLPLTEAELHAYVDGQLTPERQREIEALLAQRPDESARVQSYREQRRELHALFDPVLDETPPPRLLAAARPRTPWYAQRWVAGVAIALAGGAAGWGLRGAWRPEPTAVSAAPAAAFAQRAAVAHAVYSPEQRRPVEVDAAHEEQLVTWLSRRMGAPMKAPHLQTIGYALEGGRLLPGGQGPVAQFMYRDAGGRRLTLYVSNEGVGGQTAFRFAREGPINVFYWVDGPFGYAISAEADRDALQAVATEVYRQLASR